MLPSCTFRFLSVGTLLFGSRYFFGALKKRVTYSGMGRFPDPIKQFDHLFPFEDQETQPVI